MKHACALKVGKCAHRRSWTLPVDAQRVGRLSSTVKDTVLLHRVHRDGLRHHLLFPSPPHPLRGDMRIALDVVCPDTGRLSPRDPPLTLFCPADPPRSTAKTCNHKNTVNRIRQRRTLAARFHEHHMERQQLFIAVAATAPFPPQPWASHEASLCISVCMFSRPKVGLPST